MSPNFGDMPPFRRVMIYSYINNIVFLKYWHNLWSACICIVCFVVVVIVGFIVVIVCIICSTHSCTIFPFFLLQAVVLFVHSLQSFMIYINNIVFLKYWHYLWSECSCIHFRHFFRHFFIFFRKQNKLSHMKTIICMFF